MIQKIAGIILVITMILMGSFWFAQQGEPLTESVFRLHVIANSDMIDDQALKLEVKDAVLEMMREELESATSVDDVRDQAHKLIPEVQRIAQNVIRARNYDYPVQVTVGEYEFPTKYYGNLVFPQGNYQALRVTLGEGKGKNWWCVLFPPLCMVSTSDKGLSLETPEEAQVSLKCLELLPKGMQLRLSGN
ncbi:MAG: stage II sporulation protein R [Syntrophomonadaceae bacterium]|jgi:stage II sporulation protein R